MDLRFDSRVCFCKELWVQEQDRQAEEETDEAYARHYDPDWQGD